MEYLLVLISVTSLILNVLIYKKILHTDWVVSNVSEPVELEVLYFEPEENVVPVEEPLPPITVPMVEEVYQGWRNQKNVPLGPVVKTPELSPKPISGPLQRPDGFV